MDTVCFFVRHEYDVIRVESIGIFEGHIIEDSLVLLSLKTLFIHDKEFKAGCPVANIGKQLYFNNNIFKKFFNLGVTIFD